MKLPLSTLFAVVAFASTSLCQDVPEKAYDSFWRNDLLIRALTTVKEHSLTNIRKKPDSYRGLSVDTEIQFHELRKSSNPFFTRFTDDNYACFSAWGGEQALWHKEEYQNEFLFLFVDRTSLCFRALLECSAYQRLHVKAVVRDIFRGIPYIEVTSIEMIDDSVTEATISHAAKAKKAADAGDTATALAEYERAMRGKLPKILKAEMHCDLADVYLARGDRDNAVAQLEQATKLQPDNAVFAKMVEKASKGPLPTRKPAGEVAASRPANGGAADAVGTKKEPATGAGSKSGN